MSTMEEQRSAAPLSEELYRELKQLARQRIRRSGPLTLLDTTALVHESWFRLSRRDDWAGMGRAHFMGYAASAMRSIVVDYARARLAAQRGGGATHLEFDELPTLAQREDEYLAVHEALNALEQSDARLARLVELRYFVGLEETECAELLGVARRTVQRDWQKARALLWSMLGQS
ncbi:ECF-type sigma factor [Paucibacter sp. R3-3]|uniref:ECF-type sigma factor n=1 Tax=Roseateles agri TaxID=3098619 RepID=A0ABU5DME9_9BURK|nr:ECF-type sigma factor [Paucibacter sp. R3-3]MDY0747471.1 ECF-type sigma factor [Paucibacter sp. R3-3]